MVRVAKYGAACAFGFAGGFYFTARLVANLIKSGRMQDLINEHKERQRVRQAV